MFQRLAIAAAAWGGVLALIAAAILPWMQVPAGNEAGDLIALTPTCTRYYKTACVFCGLILIAARLFMRGWCDSTRRLAVVWFTLLLLFPYFSIVWDPKIAAQASWLQMQHENLTWLGGDICTGAEFSESPMKDRIYPVDPPRTLSIFRVPSTSLWEARMFEVSDLLDWLGYTEAFCQFSKKGWFVALLATAAVLIGTCVTDRDLQRVRILRSLRLMAAIVLVAASMAWILPLAAGMQVAKAEALVRAGNYDRAIDFLESASRIMPVLRHDTSFISQRGRLGCLVGETGPETNLFIASRFESEGRYVEANSAYRAVILDNASGTPARREACRALLRDAVAALNSGRVDAAKAQLQEVLAAEATNLKANYTLQLVYLRSGELRELDTLVSRIHQVYSSFQTPVKDAALSAFYSNSMAAALMADEPGMARIAYRKAVNP